ncbi:MAG: heme-binding domain-containing protein [Acidobacteriaceae bacterium]
MSRVRIAAICGAFCFLASLALARVHPFGDAGLLAAKSTDTSLLNNIQAPPGVRTILIEKCADCHSNQTHVPLYDHFAPVSWLMERDIVEARKAMNLSLWDTYTEDQRETLAAKMVQETKSREMPPVQYRMIHWNTRIADADVKTFSVWVHGQQIMPATAVVAVEGDPVRGKALFEKRCTGCHALTQNHEGPRLQGVYGRTSGTVANFAYSPELKKAHVVWDDQSLEKWLTDPDALIPGNDMDFLVSKPQERRDLIAYLKQSSGQ